MFDHLTSKGIPCRIETYGSEEDKTIGHVFQINIIHPATTHMAGPRTPGRPKWG